nr:iron-containing alcohol dehydrogenase [bacterium]
MNSFEFYSPTHIVFGPGSEEQAGALAKAAGARRVLLHYGSASAEKSGLLGRVRASLDAAGIAHISLGGVMPNPRLSMVRRGEALCREENIDFILAVGGGSVIDSAKAIALAAANPQIDIWNVFLRKSVPTCCLPIGAVLTIAAAGSETSNSIVITNEEGWLKRGYGTNMVRPRFAIMNPELTYTLPAYQTACGVTDIFMHTLERYFTSRLGNELTDRIAESVLKTVIRFGPVAVENGQDYQARSEIMWAGSLSHNDLTGLGGANDFATHQLGHELSALYDYAHGATLAAMWGSWARYVLPHNPARFAQYAKNVWGIEQADVQAAALAGIQKTEAFFASIGMPTSLSGLGLSTPLDEDTLGTLADKCSHQRARTIGNFATLDREDIFKIYHLANH